MANGHDERAVTGRAAEKSISTDRTLVSDLLTEAEVARELLRGAAEVSERLRGAGRVARTVGIKIRFADFTTVTRVRTLAEPTDASSVVYAEALALYRALALDRPRIRLVGVKVENLRPVDEATQLAFDLSGEAERPASAADRAVDALAARFGESVVRPASLLQIRRIARRRAASIGPERSGRAAGTSGVITNRREPESNHGA